jgi:hypothetical protein
VKKRDRDPTIAADQLGRSLVGAGFNLLVPNVETSLMFQRLVLGAQIVYADVDFALLELGGSRWMLHADHTYLDHPMHGIVNGIEARGAGIELRLYELDPDAVEERARAHDYTILAGTRDKPHGLRECHVIDGDGFIWVPSIGIGGATAEDL